MTQLQWITMNPETKEGIVVAPLVPSFEASKLLDHEKYKQTLEWAALRHLMGEIRESGGGDMNLNAIYIQACEHYCDEWIEDEDEVTGITEIQPPQGTTT